MFSTRNHEDTIINTMGFGQVGRKLHQYVGFSTERRVTLEYT